jgi:two-component system, NtrC family, nitrogen regulation sensor histidine kinase NtrY
MTALMRDAVLLQQAGQPDVKILTDLADDPLEAEVDATMIHQALTNLIKNAGEAIETYRQNGAPADHAGQIRVTTAHRGAGRNPHHG